ncbi:MAG TPA: N,N-dimethylformamidase beta subunit family domain-containing protein [Nitrospira sp.]|nr:N,N-dimethylformamidase beta subunit family domain-containing protein [Nitrospira sp.]
MTPSSRITEVGFTQASLAVTATATILLIWSTGTVAKTALAQGHFGHLLEALLFGALAGFLVYGNLCYQLARLGQLKRNAAFRLSSSQPTKPFDLLSAPALTVLVPSYKEELPVIRQTLLSAALQDYPNKRVVLLLDDPPAPKTQSDRAALWAARNLPFELQTLLDEPATRMAQARAAFQARRSNGAVTAADECVWLSDCFRSSAQWFETRAKESPTESHSDVWFVGQILSQPAESCRERGARWFARRKESSPAPHKQLLDEIDAAYAELAARFQVEFDVFERKQYCNLSHEPNKAMNLNSYLGLMGRRIRPMMRQTGLALEETSSLIGSRLIPDTPYVITLDADSLLKPHYAGTLVRLMEQPDYARVAVAQTPYSAFPNAPGVLERTAGTTTDVQYLVHQGFTYFGATFWVGANALLRKSALEEICTESVEGGHIIRRYIQDRTVIEDTESTVDLLAKGWTLHNHPERLAYSATPPDFGSLVIQRARWANGGLIILPKLLSFLRRTPKQAKTLPQALLQMHYLTSLAFAPLSVLLLLVIPFSPELMTPWMPLAALPYFALYARDLANMGYHPFRDLFRVYALNLLLIPIHLTGALTSVQQAVAGTKIPFRRTPKISGRTRTAGLDLALQTGMVLSSIALGLVYVSEARWISGAFALANAGLLMYGLHQFIGFNEMKQDLSLSITESVRSMARRPLGACAGVASDALASLTCITERSKGFMLPMRAWITSRQVLWSMVVVLEAFSPALATGQSTAPLNPVQIENRKPGTSDWILTKPARNHEIEGYASATSVNRGETIRFYVHSLAPAYRLTIYRMGWYGGSGARQMSGPTELPGYRQPAPVQDAETGLIECRWEHPVAQTVPAARQGTEEWPSGYYLAKLTAEPTGEESYILFIVRDDQRPSDYLVQASVTTFQAYNNWGGRSLYSFNSPEGQAAKVSFNRPYAGSALSAAGSGTGAGDFLTSNSIPPGYQASPAGWEYNMVRWLEKEGYDVTYATNIDVHANPSLLASHKAFLSIGHDEYWSWEMRRHIERARDRGVHLGIFSSNTCYWQIRLEPSRLTGEPYRTMVAYKENAPWHDPLYGDQNPENDHLVTTRWRSAPVNQPEAGLLGTMYLEAENPVDGEYVIAEAEAWMLAHTGLAKGSSLPGVAGYEVDGLAGSSPAGTRVVARMPAGQLAGAATLYRAASGALVFASGSMQWSWGLDDYNAPQLRKPVLNPAVQQMTRNILARFTRAED